MAVKKKGLGKGLDSLIPEKSNKPLAKEPAEEKRESESGSGIQMMKINMVEPNRDQPRKKFDEDAILELADSIKQFGVLQPLLVRKNKDYYEIIAGERRWRAAKQAGVKEVPVIVKEYTEQEIVEIGLIENIQRENLNPIEEAMAFKRLLEEFNLKQDEVAERVSKSRTAVTNSMRLLKLDERVQQMIIDDMISTGHARALLAIDDKDEQYNLANRIFDEKLSVRDTEKLVKEIKNPKKPKEKVKTVNDFIYKDLANKMKEVMGTKVSIASKGNGKGKIEIEYYSDEELEQMRDTCTNLRDLAIIDVLSSTGIRVGELVNLNIADVDFEKRECVVMGKGNKQRKVYFDARTKIHLYEYIASRHDETKALFVSLNNPHNRLSIRGIETILHKVGSNLKSTKVHPHKFRRTLATKAIDKGMPIEQVQVLLGHSQIDTTLRYAMVNQNNVKASHHKYIG